MFFYLTDGKITERLKYRGTFRSLKVQVLFYRARLEHWVLLFQVGGFIELYGRDAVLAGERLGCHVWPGFRGMEHAAGIPLRMAGNIIGKLAALGHNAALIVEGGAGNYVKNRYVRELYQVAA
jgi:hypothetical protein